MTQVHVGSLGLGVAAGSLAPHRVAPIAERAAAVFATRLEGRLRGRARTALRIDTLQAPPLGPSLAAMTDAEAADTIAAAWLDTVADRLQ